MTRFLLPPDLDESFLVGALDPGHTLRLGPPERLTVTYLDTFDWRLHRAGLALTEERGRRRRLVLFQPGRDSFVVSTGSTPRTADDLPQGHLAETIGPLMDIRALVEIGELSVERRDGRVENHEGDMVARIRLERSGARAANGGSRSFASNTLRSSSSDPFNALVKAGGVEEIPPHDLEVAAEAGGRIPGGYSSKLRIRLDSEQTAGAAARTILLVLLDTVEANVPGTIDDLDTEFLHDLRAACRRSRSALTQLEGVLPPEVVAHFKTEFKWLGGITGPLRDLDVYLLEMPTYRSLLTDALAGNLEPLEKLIAKERAIAHRAVARALRSLRFNRFVESWREALENTGTDSAPLADRRIADLAAKRITKAYRRVLKRGGNLGPEPPAEALHRLRIDAKKLRYLLEFFRSLYPKTEITARIKELKRLQDILGGFNDMEVQRDRLSGYARELRSDRGVKTSSILTVGRLSGVLERRQEDFRLAFHDAFVGFSGEPARAAFGRLFGGKGSM